MDMKSFENQLDRYERGEMNPAERRIFEASLAEWEQSPGDSDGLTRLLALRERPQPPLPLQQDYHDALASLFQKKPALRRRSWLMDAWQSFWRPRSVAWRLAEVALLLLVGVGIGSWWFGSNLTQQPLPQTAMTLAPPFYLGQISKSDLVEMQSFLLESEMLLLEVDNLSSPADEQVADISLSKEMASRLLRQMHGVEQAAVQLNDLQTVRFLSRWEMALFEIANMQTADVDIALPMVQSTIRQAGLLEELKMLQQVYQEPQGLVQAL